MDLIGTAPGCPEAQALEEARYLKHKVLFSGACPRGEADSGARKQASLALAGGLIDRRQHWLHVAQPK